MSEAALRPGPSDPVLHAHAVFRAVMNAMARPGTIHAVPVVAEAPPPLSPAAAAVALTLLDADTGLWLDPALRAAPEVAGWLAFYAGVGIVDDPEAAGFALLADPPAMPALAAFAQGDAEYPDRGATLILQVPRLEGGEVLVLEGPGLAAPARFAPMGLPDGMAAQLRANRERFPRGVDLLLVAGDRVAALPRSCRVTAAPAEEGKAVSCT